MELLVGTKRLGKSWFNIQRNKRPASSSLAEADFLDLSQENVRSIEGLVHSGNLLNRRQCVDLSCKLSWIVDNIQELVVHYRASMDNFRGGLEYLYKILEKAKLLVKKCCKDDWITESIFQIGNEKDFQVILLEVALSYYAIYEQVKGMSETSSLQEEDLCQSSIFAPAAINDIQKDQDDLRKRLEDVSNQQHSHESSIQDKLDLDQCLARYLLLKWEYTFHQRQTNELDISRSIKWKECDSIGTCGNNCNLGSGSFGHVLRSKWMGIPCAKKVFYGEANKSFFLKEASILSHLNHPHIIKFFCCGNEEESDDCFIIMELMEMSLEMLIFLQENKKVSFSFLGAFDIIVQIARGMWYLHGMGVAHLDLNPSNVVVDIMSSPHLGDQYSVKLVDFSCGETKGNTMPTFDIGTTRYRAPELYRKAHLKDNTRKANLFKADVYSFAITCAEILCLQKPFEKVTPSALYEDLMKDVRPKLPTTCPKELVALLNDCWNTQSNLRPNFIEICAKLEEVRHNLLRGLSNLDKGVQEVGIYSTSYQFIWMKVMESSTFQSQHIGSMSNEDDTSAGINERSTLSSVLKEYKTTFDEALEEHEEEDVVDGVPLYLHERDFSKGGYLEALTATPNSSLGALPEDMMLSEVGKLNLIGENLVIDLTQDLLGVSSTGYVIRTSCSREGLLQLCALKRIDMVDEKTPDLPRLKNLHVVHLIDYWIEERDLFLVMELMDGDLAKLIARTKKIRASPFSLHVGVDLMLQIAKGMLYLHEVGISHPHLKCENVLYKTKNKTEEYEVGDVLVKLGGFGCSRPANLESRNRDVLCFGLTCLEILTGDERPQVTYGIDIMARSKILETMPVTLRDCIRSCLDMQTTFVEVVMVLLGAKSSILQSSEDEILFSSENTQTEIMPIQINDGSEEIFLVHQLHPQLGDVSTSIHATIIFFHGFYKVPEEWRRTWMTRDNKHVWPQKWLPDDLGAGNIRVLSVSFDGNLNVSNKYNRFEMGKNLVQRLILSPKWKLGEISEAIFLVGHSFGGVLIKSLVTEAQNLVSEQVLNTIDHQQEVMKCEKFLKQLTTIVFYSVPHTTSSVGFEDYISKCKNIVGLQKSSFMQSFWEDTRFIADMDHLSANFESAVQEHVNILAFLEGKPMNKKHHLVTEKSYEGQPQKWKWHKVEKDNHFEVCRPNSKDHTAYKILLHHLQQHLNPSYGMMSTQTEVKRLSLKAMVFAFIAIVRLKRCVEHLERMEDIFECDDNARESEELPNHVRFVKMATTS